MASTIDTAAKRRKLPIRAEPYWEGIGKGRALGFRRTASGGTWIARAGRKQHRLEDASKWEHLDTPNARSGAYEQARKEAMAWIEREEGGQNTRYTVEKCIEDYEKDLTIRRGGKAAREAVKRLEHHIPEDLMKQQVRKLTTRELVDWRNSMLPVGADEEKMRRAKDSANRTLTVLKAALNHAYKTGVVESDAQWRRVGRFRAVAKGRTLFLTDEQVKRLMEAAQGPFHDLCKAAVLTGARYGELCTLKVKDLDVHHGVLHVDGKTGPRPVVLSSEALRFFKDQKAGKMPEAPMLPNEDGGHWQKDQQRAPMANAVRKARAPQGTIFYSLRHYHISRAIAAGVNLLLVSKNVGTSMAMIQKNYGHVAIEDSRKVLDLVELGL